jgi:hypothetical protein
MIESLELYLSQYLGIAPEVLEAYGAFDVSVASDLPLFIDPFLIFHSDKPEYQALHQGILKYLRFLLDKAANGQLDRHLVASWYEFKEVKQNWFRLGEHHGFQPSREARARASRRRPGSDL